MRHNAWALRIIVAVAVLLLAVPALADNDGAIRQLTDLAGKTIAIQTGTNQDQILNEQNYLRGKIELSYYNTPADMIQAVKTGKAAAAPLDKPVAAIYCNQNPELMMLPEELDAIETGVGFQKGSPLTAEFNRALAQMKQEGVLADLEAKWTSADERVKKTVVQDWDAVKGTLNAWVDTQYEPMCYVGEGGELLGYDVDVILSAARIMGYRVEFTPCNFDGLIPALVSGKADLVASGMSITPERAESIDFSDSHYVSSVLIVVLRPGAAAAGANSSFWDTIKQSFYKTFIKENRWQLFAEGIGTTLFITVMAALLGTLLGFAIYMLCRACPAVVPKCFEMVFSLLERMPIIVFLMVLYYIICGSIDVSGIAVSIAAFTMTFAASMYGMLKNGVKAVSFGQTEAAYALGYNKRDAFFKIVLPQAARFFIPSYRSELISLVKGTAVVGYIAVQDLTKMGDIVRSRTYEAFFPLFTTAVIYVILTWLLTLLINHLEISLDPKRRSKENILKGVNVK